MTKAQNSFLKAIPDILQEIEFNATAEARAELTHLLSDVSGKSLWGLTINKVLLGNSKANLDDLIEQLSEQAADNASTMSKIVGWDATLILLKLYNNADKCAKYVQTNCGEIKV